MKGLFLYFVFNLFGTILCIEQDFKGFDDSILFTINWPGSPDTLENLVDKEIKPEENEILQVTTTHKEQYECRLPKLQNKVTTSIEDYDGPTPFELLKPIFSQKICSYRLESYWSYEVCHGRHVRQYHEDREGKEAKTHEYYLGRWSEEEHLKLGEEIKAAQAAREKLKTTKVEGTTLPYVEMVMSDGTICDLSGQPRKTRILYVCYTHGKHEIYSMKETTTCEYEIIILSGLLCDHPQFKSKDVSENEINCLPIGDAPKKPRNLLKSEVESMKLNHQSIRLSSNDGETHLKFELHPISEEGEVAQQSKAPPLIDKPAPITDDSPVRAFLNGENCLDGGTGWWKYEFCYGRHVAQYHVDRAGARTSLTLGHFDERAHLDWIKENRGKAPKPVGEAHTLLLTLPTPFLYSALQSFLGPFPKYQCTVSKDR
ncbi:endoplasmic reticulum lectin 1 isoform X2 [Zerene cesonia]|uniref:endoplasmic reticulum lectin 1 isoform X2 n=1 Tax=Zerene cesonia TaxID=33412 RepID=UPI0018E50167|nr:endoplasmic reticulum lectin 1 isoform X2 [Zerene cesonia]